MAVDYFLKLDGIPGESQDKTHKSEIEILSWSWGAAQKGTFHVGGGGGAGRVDMQDFKFKKHLDKASPKLMLACAQGEHIKSAVLVCRKAGKEQQEYLKITFTDLIVSSYEPSGSAAAEPLPVEEIAFNFGKIDFTYREQKPDGTLGGGVSAVYELKARTGA